MKRICHILILPLLPLLPLLLLSSCESDEPGLLTIGNRISFVAAGLPGVSSRANYNIFEKIQSRGITISAISPEAPDGFLSTHFEGEELKRDVDGAFRSNGCTWPGTTDRKYGQLRFFAFHPLISDMKDAAGVGDECFAFSNSSVKNGTDISYDYRLNKFRVAPDIYNQVDFVSAIGEGNKIDHLYCGIELLFEHQLSGVEVGVWGGSSLYDIEVAGVRVGGIVVEADFSLSAEAGKKAGNDNTIGEWFIDQSSLRGYVDYVFRQGDKVVAINVNEHNTKETAVSIMGNGGNALLIPQKQDMWDYKNDRTGSPKGMYFSSLVRVTQHDGDHHCIFPSKDPQSQDYIVYLSVRKSDGEVMERLDKNGNIYGTSDKYYIPATEELRYYGWAAAPANVDWKPGYTYRYVLDYTNGVGVHDPYDPNPAATVVDWGGVEITTTTGEWSSVGVIGKNGWGANTNNTAPDGTVWWK